MTRLLALALLLAVAARVESQPNERFSIQAFEVKAAMPASDDGRYAVQANARLAEPARSSDRFRLKTALVDCSNTPAEVIFADGFEN